MKLSPPVQESAADSFAHLSGPVQAIVFDAVGTLIYPEPSVAQAYANAIQRHCGVTVDSAQVRIAVRTALQGRSRTDDLRTDEQAEQQFWADLVRQLCPGSDGFQACFDDLFQHFGRADNWRCYPDVAGLIDDLLDRGLRLAIASNFDHRLNSVCRDLPQLKRIADRIISSEVGWRKPAVPFYSAVAAQLQIAPERILVVGDDLQNDVQGAQAAGMQAAWLCRPETRPESLPEVSAVVLDSLSELPPLLNLLLSDSQMHEQ